MYSTLSWEESIARALRYGLLARWSHSLTCHSQTNHIFIISLFYLYFPATWHHRPFAGTHCTYPQRDPGWVDLGGCLYTETDFLHRELNVSQGYHASQYKQGPVYSNLVDRDQHVTTKPWRTIVKSICFTNPQANTPKPFLKMWMAELLF